MNWPPHITVGTIVQRNGRFLMVEELDEGRQVFNQPAGHLDPGETLAEAAVRETLEETGWLVELTGITGIYHYHSPLADITYHRINFAAAAVERQSDDLDEGIVSAQWLTLDELRSRNLRSPVVIACIEDYLAHGAQPLSFLRHL